MGWVSPTSTDSPIPAKSRGDWKVAAETWRLPYWDFALRRSYNQNMACVPQQALIDGDPLSPLTTGVGLPTIPKYPDNPLYAFRYPLPPGKKLSDYGIVNTGGLPVSSIVITISQWEQQSSKGWTNGELICAQLEIQKRTVRYAPRYTGDAATIKAWTDGIGDMKALLAAFSARTAGWRKDLTSMMRDSKSFNGFSNGDGTGVPDLETIHGSVHVATGGNGNMSSVPCAAFDCIFFIYHAYVIHPPIKLLVENLRNWMLIRRIGELIASVPCGKRRTQIKQACKTLKTGLQILQTYYLSETTRVSFLPQHAYANARNGATPTRIPVQLPIPRL